MVAEPYFWPQPVGEYLGKSEGAALMRVVIQAPWLPRPHGGMTVLFEYGNGLRRRGHEVTMVATLMGHGVPAAVETIDELRSLEWLPIDDGLTCIDGEDAAAVAALDPDVVIRFSPEPLVGQAGWSADEFVVLQALQVLPPEFEEALLSYPAPKLAVARWLANRAETHHRQHNIDRDVFHLPSGIDHLRFGPPAVPTGPRPIDVLMIYNPAPTKACRVGVKACELAAASHGDLRVEMFGGFSRPDWLSESIAYHHQPHPDRIAELYQQSKVFLLSSALEGFGLTSLEAMASGAALVITDNGGSSDYAEPDVNALVAPPGDHQGLADHLLALLADEQRRASIAAAGTATASRYRWETAIDRLEAIITDEA